MMCADMATTNSRASVEFPTPHRVSDPVDCLQPPCCDSILLSSQLLKGDTRREFLVAKDVSKRKRVNRIAKLKQCKLDARREQWLSQGSHCRPKQDKQDFQHTLCKEMKLAAPTNSKAGKHASLNEAESHLHGVVISEFFKEENMITMKNDKGVFSGPNFVGSVKCHSKVIQTLEVVEMGRPELLLLTSQIEGCKNKRRPSDCGMSYLDEAQDATANLQFHCAVVLPEKSGQHGEHGKGSREECSTGPLFSPSESVCTSSSSALNGDNDLPFIHETEDDWEVAADALYVPGPSILKVNSQLPKSAPEGMDLAEKKAKLPSSSESQHGILKPEYKCKAAGFSMKTRGGGGRAWRPDDVCRPPTLPCLSKERNFQIESSTSVWGGVQQGLKVRSPPSVPSYCPICTEELDVTDSSFFPCSCGFRLCLFCHHRISSDDGRCPGCRKAYSPEVAMKLSCTTTFWLRL